MGIHAQDTKHAGAYRLHVLASTLDHNEGCNHVLGICKGGSGNIETAALLASAEQLKVKRSTFYYWLADGIKAGIFAESNGFLYMANQAKLSTILLCNSIDEHKAIIPLKLLFQPGWKAIIWAAYLKANHHSQVGYTNTLQPVYKANLISAKKLQDITGVKERTQRRLNKWVSSNRNIAITTTDGTLEGAWEHRNRPGKFLFIDPQQNNRRVWAFAIPARRSVKNEHAKIGARGKRRSIAAAIVKGSRLVTFAIMESNYQVLPRQAETQSGTFTAYPRVFIDQYNPDEVTARDVFISRNRRRKLGVYDALSVGIAPL